MKDFLRVIGDRMGEMVSLAIGYDHHRLEKAKDFSSEDLAASPVKIVCAFPNGEVADEFKRFAGRQALFQKCFISKSWQERVEFNAADSTKGIAMDFIRQHLDGIHTTIDIGDYENDLPLMTHADIGVAVGSALECVKQAADRIVKPCRNSPFGI